MISSHNLDVLFRSIFLALKTELVPYSIFSRTPTHPGGTLNCNVPLLVEWDISKNDNAEKIRNKEHKNYINL